MPLTLFKENHFLNFKSIFTTLVATLVTVGAGIWITQFTGPVPLSITQTLAEKQSTFNTSGDAEIVAVPDEAQIRLGIEIKQDSVAAAQDEANKIINSITAAIKKMGIDDKSIQTQNYRVSTEYDYSNPERKITGYQVSTQILVKATDFDKLNQIIDQATSLGANQVGGINFSLSEAKKEELKKEARIEAIQEAKDSAEELAKLAGVKLGKVVNVSESEGGNYPYPMYDRAELSLPVSGGGEPTQVEPGSEIYSYSVTLSYETL